MSPRGGEEIREDLTKLHFYYTPRAVRNKERAGKNVLIVVYVQKRNPLLKKKRTCSFCKRIGDDCVWDQKFSSLVVVKS